MRKGVTLVELLVAILVSTILLASVTLAFTFLNDTDRLTINESKANYALSNLKDYIIENSEKILKKQYTYDILSGIDKKEYFKYDTNKRILYYLDGNEYTQLYDSMPFKELDFKFYHEDVFNKCTIYYKVSNNESELTFLIGEYNLEDIKNYLKNITPIVDENKVGSYDNGILTIEYVDGVETLTFEHLPFTTFDCTLVDNKYTISYTLDGLTYEISFNK